MHIEFLVLTGISHSVVVVPLLNWQSRDKVGNEEKDAVSTLLTLKTSELQHFTEQAQ